MTTEEAIKNRILYHCDERQHFYKLGKGVIDYCVKDIISDLSALCEQAEREKGCEYCASRFGIATHHINGAGLQTGTNKIANFCPMCGKRLED